MLEELAVKAAPRCIGSQRHDGTAAPPRAMVFSR